MKVIFVAAALVAGALTAGSAQASQKVSGHEFLNACEAATANSAGHYYEIDGGVQVWSGSATGFSFDDCNIRLDDGAALSISDVSFVGSTITNFRIAGGEKSKVKMSNFKMTVSGDLDIGPGHSGNGSGPLSGGSVSITNSTLAGNRVRVLPSCDADSGKASIKSSELDAGALVVVAASYSPYCSGYTSNGKVSVSKSHINVPSGGLSISSGPDGSTKVTSTTLSFNAGGIHSLGKCSSKDNVPDVACS